MSVIGACCCGGGGVENPCSCWEPLPQEVVLSGFSASQSSPNVCDDETEENTCAEIPGTVTPVAGTPPPVIEEVCTWQVEVSTSTCGHNVTVDVFLTQYVGYAQWEAYYSMPGGGVVGYVSDDILCTEDIFDEVELDLLSSDCDSESATITLTPTAL